MPSTGQLSMKRVLKMLRSCAPDFTYKDKKHLRWFYYKDKRVRTPLGPHGQGRKSNNFDVEIGHIRHLVNSLELDEECVKTHLPQLSQSRASQQERSKPTK